MAWRQNGRICSIETSLGPDAFVPSRFKGREAVSELFRFEMDLASENDAVDLHRLIGRRVSVRIDLPGGAARYVNAFISRFSHVGNERDHGLYRAELVPWLWFLSQRTDCRIFQNLSAPEIVRRVFDHLGFRDFDFRLTGRYQARVNCVQYGETDLNFVMRLLEDEGIFFFFEHDAQSHKLIFVDSGAQIGPCPDLSSFMYDPVAGGNRSDDRIESWMVAESLVSGKHALSDYSFFDPNTSLLVDAQSSLGSSMAGSLEKYDYPGSYVGLGAEEDGKLDHGEQRVRLRVQECDAGALVAEGAGSCRALCAGFRSELQNHPRKEWNQSWFVLEVEHELVQAGGWGSGDPEVSEYRNRFSCIPHRVPYRPARVTEKPRVKGPQTAVVTGPEGEEIFIDKHGRIKVQFPWDREGQKNENSSCWIRVAQPLAGKYWGMQFNPRIGQEVVVDFLEGDPDRPIVTGRVYNAENPITYSVATQSGVKTRSSKQGSAANCNEIRFEDKKDAEELYIQAEKDLNQVVKNCRTESIGANQSESVGGNKSISVGIDHTESIGGNAAITVASNMSVMIGGNDDRVVGSDMSENVGMNYSANIGSMKTETVALASMETIGGAKALTVGAAYAVTVAGAMNVAVGLASLEEIGLTKIIKAGNSVEITCGDSKFTLNSDGTISVAGKTIEIAGSESVTIHAPVVNINGGPSVKVTAEFIDLN